MPNITWFVVALYRFRDMLEKEGQKGLTNDMSACTPALFKQIISSDQNKIVKRTTSQLYHPTNSQIYKQLLG